MISAKELKLKENSRVSLKVTVPAAEVKKEYEAVLKEYCQKAVIKGFRPGKVPPEILERKFGEELKSEASLNLVQKSLEEVFNQIEEKPLRYEKPLITNLDQFEQGTDFHFEVEYDTFPKITLGNYNGLKVERPEVSIDEEDINRELQILQERNTFVKPKENAEVKKGDVVSVDYVELDENDNPIEATRNNGFVFEVGKLTSRYQFDEDILNLREDNEKLISKSYPTDYQIPELAGKTVKLKVTVRSIKEKIVPQLDDEFAQDISNKYKTLEDLKADIATKLKEAAAQKIEDLLATQLVKQIVEHSKIPLPESMIKADLENRWHDFMAELNMKEEVLLSILKKEEKSKEDLFLKWRPSTEEKLKAEIVIEEIQKKENIDSSEAELEEEIKKYAANRNLEYEQAKESFEKMNLIGYLKSSIAREKTLKFLIENAQIKKGKTIKYLDLASGNW